MARASLPSGIIPNVWVDNADIFDHGELKDNWDATDAELTRLGTAIPTLGDVKAWYKMAGTTPDPGWVICDGRTVSSPDHDFPHLSTNQRDSNGWGVDASNVLHVPDFRGLIFMGADSVLAVGTPAAQGDGEFPGVGGVQGSNEILTVPDHHHRHSHVHLLNEGNASSDDTGNGMQNDAHDPYFINTDASGSGHNVALLGHTHHLLSQYISNAHKPSHPDARVKDLSTPERTDAALAQLQTSTQIATTSGTDEVPLPSTGPGTALTMDGRPSSVGLLYLMYVKTAT